MTPEQIESASRLLNIFFPYAALCRANMIKQNGRFVHYTSAANALSIIKTKRVWMRNTTCMSDYREVRHGFDALCRYFANDSAHGSFQYSFERMQSGCCRGSFRSI